MEPFSITVGALGITNFALARIDELYNLIKNIADANTVLSDVASNLEAVQRSLRALETLTSPDAVLLAKAKEDLKKAGLAESVNKCGETCDKFEKKLQSWTKHSGGTKLSFRDRLSTGLWNKEQIQTLRVQVQTCQSLVQFATQNAQLLIQLRSQQDSQVDREETKQQLSALQSSIERHIEETKGLQQEIGQRRERLGQEPENEEDGGAQRALALEEVERQSRLVEADQVSLAVVFSQVRRERSGQEIGSVFTSEDSRALVGLPESVLGKVDQKIGNVTTQDNSAAVVGVFDKTVDVRDFFKRS